MSPKMFNHGRAYQTPEQTSLSIKTINTNSYRLTCAEKYSQNTRITPTSNCVKEQKVYNSRGQLIGRNYCVLPLL